MNFLPQGPRRFYIDSTTFISIVHELHELHELSKSTTVRRDSVTEIPSDIKINQWQRLFSFTRGEAVWHIENFQVLQDQELVTFDPDAYPMWSWDYMKNLGFDQDSYRYWLCSLSSMGRLVRIPSDIASTQRHSHGMFSLFVFASVDKHIDRISYAQLQRIPRIHVVHDWQGFPQKAVVLRD
ncbi:hypothetical protein P153DRAFT_281450 [Dothidotthia symphoricarpi CBS 119687]|uniref:Uncharacterized protein n=1 Tax=Dothidotthia symphoricarpi CBS 119687 TaxID=1392245 RepID=A0A6A6AQH1_9PLEO|nr:uncharacterized protein P153DRAFT_281450 [Dothidotthia symphoricarpi CBS 119687]KAF2134179.1 hypothetical protein P153DRAFT_281450 [Dothidotthia symphoricarpi CBS 119687]